MFVSLTKKGVERALGNIGGPRSITCGGGKRNGALRTSDQRQRSTGTKRYNRQEEKVRLRNVNGNVQGTE